MNHAHPNRVVLPAPARRAVLVLTCALLAAAPRARAGDTAAPAPGDDVLVKTRAILHNLRFAEDWSALKAPDATTDHWWPESKTIALDDEGEVTLVSGGQLRLRYESQDNKNLRGTVPGNNDFILMRARLYGDLRLSNGMRLFVEGLSADIHGNDAPPTAIDRNNPDLLNAFVDLPAGDSIVRLGRSELQYGAQRLISPLEWGNTRRTFQGAVVKTPTADGSFDVIVVRPVIIDPRDDDGANASRWFGGVYATRKLSGGDGLDLYALALTEDENILVGQAGMPPGDSEVYTFGTRWWGKRDAWDFELEAAHQRGARADSSIGAFMGTARAGFTIADAPGSPRLGVDLDWASGDDDPTDSQVGTFNQLFPLGHAWLGYLDLVGRQNIFAIMPNATFKTSPETSFRVSWTAFRLDEKTDALYNAGGAPTLVDPTGASGDDVGREIDLTLTWLPAWMAPHGEILFGYSTFSPGHFVETLGDGKRADLIYVQFQFTF